MYALFRTLIVGMTGNANIAPLECHNYLGGSGTEGTNLPTRKVGMETKNVYQLDPNFSYAIKELAHITNLADESITRLFEDEPGVVIFRMQHTGRRTYRTFRIPGWVAIRAFGRMTVTE
jgi:hypothetical protein